MLRHYKQWETLAADLMHIQAVLNKWRGERGIIPYEIAVSFGVYQADAGETNDMKQMLDFANYAMRSAKTAAGGSCFLYDEQMRNKALFEQGLEGRLVSAMEQGEFEAYYQPKVDMDTGRIVGCEALVRWNHPEQGLLMPGSFIPFFEKKGLIVRVDLHMYADGWMRDVPLLQSHVISRRCISDMTGLPARFLKLLIGSRFPIICWKWRLPKVRLPMHLRVCPPP